MKIDSESRVEELVEANPEVVRFLIRYGLPCVVCGEPFWGTIGELAEQKGFGKDQIEKLIADMNESFAG